MDGQLMPGESRVRPKSISASGGNELVVRDRKGQVELRLSAAERLELDHTGALELHAWLSAWLVEHPPGGGPWTWDPERRCYVDPQGLPSGRVTP